MLTAKESTSNSDSDFTTLLVLPRVSESCTAGSLASFEMSTIPPDRDSRPYFKLNGCKSSEIASAKNSDSPWPALDGTLQPVLTESPYISLRKKGPKHSMYDELLVSDIRKTSSACESQAAPWWSCDCVLRGAAACRTKKIVCCVAVCATRWLVFAVVFGGRENVYGGRCFIHACASSVKPLKKTSEEVVRPCDSEKAGTLLCM